MTVLQTLVPMKGWVAGQLCYRYQVVVRGLSQAFSDVPAGASSEPIPFPYIMSGDIRVNGGCGTKGYVSGYLVT